MRIAIIGWPGTGKTTLGKGLAEQFGVPYRSTDEAMHLGWSEASQEVSTWFNEPAWVIEGVALPRAFRKWRAANPDAPAPVDRVIYLSTLYKQLTPQQAAMGKGVDTVYKEIADWLPTPVTN
jgi:dephospho-CoA kinase